MPFHFPSILSFTRVMGHLARTSLTAITSLIAVRLRTNGRRLSGERRKLFLKKEEDYSAFSSMTF